MTVNHQSS